MLKNHKGIYLQLHTKKDSDILTKLEREPNKQGYIKSLIRENMNMKNDKNRSK